MILDIIIPQYKEGEQEIKNLLESIDMQVGINKNDVQVTIVNDCSDKKLSLDFLKQFTLNINYLQLSKNVGPGLTRQAGLDNTSAPYVMFCDADDCLYKADVLSTIISVLKNQLSGISDWPFLQTNFYEENFQQGFQLIKHEGFNMIFLHGKVFNRQFLNEHNIRFRPGLRTFEDTFFCKTCSLSAAPKTTRTLDIFSYVWKRADGSISSSWNHDGKSYMFWKVDDYIGCNEGALDFFRENFEKNPIDRMVELIYHTIVYTYLNFYTTDFAGADELTISARTKLIEMSKRIIINNKDFIKEVPEDLKANLHKECLAQIKNNRAAVAEMRPSFNEFLTNVLELPTELVKPLFYTVPLEPETQNNDAETAQVEQK